MYRKTGIYTDKYMYIHLHLNTYPYVCVHLCIEIMLSFITFMFSSLNLILVVVTSLFWNLMPILQRKQGSCYKNNKEF